MSFSPADLGRALAAHAPRAATGLLVALSGGADSASLLTALTLGGAPALRHLPLRAVHIDHGLQPAAAAFREGCERLCGSLRVPLDIVAVAVARGGGVSVEAAARAARYQALARHLRAGECLLTAHHAGDQAETVLLQLLRGAGLKGLCAMPPCRRWAKGWHLRPLLGIARRDLRAFAAARAVDWVADPMNVDPRFDRVYLRERIWPLLEERWPGTTLALSRSAGHLAEAQSLADDSAAGDLRLLRDGNTLSLAGLRILPPERQRNAVRHWLSLQAVTPPSTLRLGEALRQVLDAREQQLPAVVWGDHALRRYRGRLHLTPAAPLRLADTPRQWRVAADAELELGGGLGRLAWLPQRGGLNVALLPPRLVVRRRTGGERLKPHRHASSRSLQHLCQDRGIAPWLRDALPLVYAGDTLIAVADLWLDARWCVDAGATGVGCAWEGAPALE